MRLLGKALTFDDVLLVPAFSSVLPRDTDLATSLSRNIRLNLPLVSAAMDTVTEARLAIALAQEGGVGIVHKNLTPKQQAAEVARVKRYESGVLRDPITVTPEMTVRQVMKLANNYLSATAIAATSEALAVGVKAGLDPTLMVEVINSGSGKNTATEVKFPRHVLPGTFDAGFALGGMYKDVRLFTEEAEDEGVPIFVGSAVRHLWQFSVAQLGPDEDMTALAKSVEAWAGVELRASDRPGD